MPPLPAPPPAGVACNQYLPGDSTLRRLLWVVAFYAANGFYVLLDNHWREDDTVLADPAAWAANWAQLVRTIGSWSTQHILCDGSHARLAHPSDAADVRDLVQVRDLVATGPRVADRVLVDIANEPDQLGMAYEPQVWRASCHKCTPRLL